MSASRSTQCGVRWTTRLVTLLIAAATGYVTFAFVKRVAIDYLYKERNQIGLVLALLILFFLFLLLSIATYLRTFVKVKTDCGLVPLQPGSKGARREELRKEGGRSEADIDAELGWAAPDTDIDSPGLERFYSKDAFICESDGRPRWCHDCGQFKPDRASHSRELGRCIRKMDHYCPWVGGMVSETSFKFFAQFTFYCTILCAVVLAGSAYSIAKQTQEELSVDPLVIVALVLACFFGLFCFMMVTTALRFIFTNQTNIDLLKKQVTYQIAIRVPLGTPSTSNFNTITYPLSHPNEAMSQAAAPNGSAFKHHAQRDKLARRTFAILKTEPGENPWHLGYRKNWQQVMGNNIFDYLFPVSNSPCINHDSPESDYPFGPLVKELKVRHGLIASSTSDESQKGIELDDMSKRRRARGGRK